MLMTLLKQYFKTKYRRFHTRESLETWQNQKVINHLQGVLEKSKYYRQLYQGLHLDNWRHFPVICKKEMMDNFDTLNTCGISHKEAFNVALQAEETRLFNSNIGDVAIGLSSGTSGNRGLFLVSPSERFSWAGAILAKLLPNFILYPQRIAFFMRANSSLYTSLKSQIIKFQFYDLFIPIDEHIEQLNNQNPTILVAPPSLLRQLGIRHDQLTIKPKRIISIAEVLEPIDEDFISKKFKQKIHQVYQATEGFLAHTCANGTLHLNEDLLVIQKEMIDDCDGLFYPIITDFHRFSQPIIRYKLNDILREKKDKCPCGSVFTAIESIEGRSDDLFYFSKKNSTHELKAIYPDFVRRAVLFADSSIEEYRVVQKSLKTIEVALKAPSKDLIDIQQNILKRFSDLFEEQCVIAPHISFCEFQPPQVGKKLRRIERQFRVEER